MIEKKKAPVVLFTYNRPDHTRRTIEALAANELASETDLFIYSDAAKNEKAVEGVNSVREYITTLPEKEMFQSVSVIFREENCGLAKNIIEGVTEIANRYGKVIVLEDDLITNKFFLRFMNDGLDRYENVEQVKGVSGYSFFDDNRADRLLQNGVVRDSYLTEIAGISWSWATWADRWSTFDKDAKGWERLVTDAAFRKKFNYDNTYNFYQILKAQQQDAGTNSWAIRWYYTNFLRNGLYLCPAKSLVGNDGWDGSGVHCGDGAAPTAVHALQTEKAILEFPTEIKELPEVRKHLKKELIKISEPSVLKRIYHNVFRKNYIGEA